MSHALAILPIDDIKCAWLRKCWWQDRPTYRRSTTESQPYPIQEVVPAAVGSRLNGFATRIVGFPIVPVGVFSGTVAGNPVSTGKQGVGFRTVTQYQLPSADH